MNLPPPGYPENTRIHFDLETQTYTKKDEEYNVIVEWDPLKKAWFPKNQNLDVEVKSKKKSSKKRVKENVNTSVYVSQLPEDVTVKDLERIKIYHDEHGNPKGDALITYFKPESVDLAISLLDETEIAPGCIIRVQEPIYETKDDDNIDEKKKKKKTDKKIVKKRIETMENQKIAAAKECSSISDVHKNRNGNPRLILELKDELRSECGKIGPVPSVQVYDKSDGFCSVRFKNENDAAICIKKLNARIPSEFSELTNLKKLQRQEEDEEEEDRINKFGEWLEKHDEIK
ncbi:hypothetical protein O9G_002384 [Rozella allomycis CSF55]|uniref:RRM domain-containing protein n=1 Tax=Rozella allomycis (strain CSF55) TaxID=988480 RepID=A0A075ATW8_ROZAC|nr:hypothetical protein O9G_002384 [Rozella allomycis CSF55]|eukprot:EPZ33746.1 hypothetical protein O9G_002384 [Rozella allomycis CSF55]